MIDFTVKNPYTADLRIVEKFAADNGLKVELRGPSQIQVDIDSPELPADFAQRLSMTHAAFSIKKLRAVRSRNGNIHLTVTVGQDLDPYDALLFEAVLGSDFKRVALGYKSLNENDFQKYLSVLFAVPGAEVMYDGPYNPFFVLGDGK
jgi:hypothetical protein